MAVKAIGDTAIFYGDKQNEWYDNGAWMTLLDIPWLKKIEEAQLYKTVIRTLWLESIGWSKKIKEDSPEITLIGLIDHPLSTHISKLSAVQQHAFLADLEYLDGIMTLTEEERQWYQTAIPSKPVEKVGLPFPFESYEKRFGSYRENKKEFIGLGVGAADNDRNFISNLMAFRRLQLQRPELKGVILSVPDQLIPYCTYWASNIDNVFVHEREDMPEFYDVLSRCQFVINLADRNTPGRIQGEAAFFEVPVIGSNRLELQEELFPILSVKPYELENVVKVAEYLLDDPDASKKIGQKARKTLHRYDFKHSKERYGKLLNRIKER
jgi:hypothetical protein